MTHDQIDAGSLAMSVSLVEPLGANTLLHGNREGCGQVLTASLAGIRQSSRAEPSVKLAVDAEYVYLFDKLTEQRIAAL